MSLGRKRETDYTVAEVAAYLGVSDITVRVWITRGHLRRNGHGKISKSVLAAFVKKRDKQRRPFPADTPTASD